MKIAIIADIHSNLEAFQAVLEDIKKKRADKTLCAGDIVGYGANPNECIELVRKHKIPSVMGNHDLNAVSLGELEWFNPYARQALIWTNRQLTQQSRDYLSKLPLTMMKSNILFVHGSPDDPIHEYIFPEDSPERFLEGFKGAVLVLAHTHVPFIKKAGTKFVINPGAVGQPRDLNPKAAYCMFDTEKAGARIIRVSYNIKAAADKIIKAGLPKFLAERLYRGE